MSEKITTTVLDEMVTSLMTGGPVFVDQVRNFIAQPEDQTARAELDACARLLAAPRWWKSYMREGKTQAILRPYIANRQDEGDSDLAGRLIQARENVAADAKSCEPYLPALMAKALPDDPYFHFSRFCEELQGDLDIACQMSAAIQRVPDGEVEDASKFLTDISENLLAGAALISALADRVNKEVNKAV